VTSSEDPVTGTGTLDPDLLVANSKHVTLKNLTVEDAVAGTGMPPGQALTADIHARFPDDMVASLRILWGNLPRKTRLLLVFSLGPDKKPVLPESDEWARTGVEISDAHAEYFPEQTPDALGCPVQFDRKRILIVHPLDRESTTIHGIRLSHGAPVRVGINVVPPEDAKGVHNFSLVRVTGERILGGVTYQIRIREK
jgi:hypothetical protein